MNQKKMSAMLKGIAIVVGMMLAIFLAFIMPMLAKECKTIYPEAKDVYLPGLCFGYYLGVLCYYALYQFFKICVQIGNDNSFSKENMKSLNVIGTIGIIAAISWFGALIVLIAMGTMSIPFFILMMVALFVSISITIIATVLSHLVNKAFELKEENELTI